MTVKAKRFRIGVEGATTDGREIQREWLEQMAASYNPAVYTALINLEHIKSYLPDSTFNRYGKVTALFAEEITEGPLAGKMALYADVEPTESLVELVKKGQKLFTSMEVSPKFADTGKAYLVGLAATDDPASLGTEMLTFSASAAHNPLANRKQNPANLFTAAEETVIELEEIQEDKPSLFARVTALFTKKEQSDDARFSDVHKAVELVATEQQNLSARTEKSLSEQEERLSELETALQEQQAGLLSLRTAPIALCRRARDWSGISRPSVSSSVCNNRSASKPVAASIALCAASAISSASTVCTLRLPSGITQP